MTSSKTKTLTHWVTIASLYPYRESQVQVRVTPKFLIDVDDNRYPKDGSDVYRRNRVKALSATYRVLPATLRPILDVAPPSAWCVQHREGWCRMARQPKSGARPRYRDSVKTTCDYFVTLPIGFEFRVPTCPECRKSKKK